MNNTDISKYIDHTLLKQQATEAMIKKLCHEANEYRFFSVCINPFNLTIAKKELISEIKLCTVVGFPLGANSSFIKGQETKLAIDQGADEIDMVINIGALKDKNDQLVVDDIATVIQYADKAIVKVIIETCLLNQEEKIRSCHLIEKAGAHFIKTSTGFSTNGAQLDDIKLFKTHLKNNTQIKASGGIKTKQQALDFIEAGANRLGTSSGIELVTN